MSDRLFSYHWNEGSMRWVVGFWTGEGQMIEEGCFDRLETAQARVRELNGISLGRVEIPVEEWHVANAICPYCRATFQVHYKLIGGAKR